MKRRLRKIFSFLMALIVIAIVVTYFALQQSLPQLDGQIASDSLTADVTIERDAGGIPTITATNRVDLAYATGFVHGQDRFFHMDLTRRKAAGELAEIFGAAAVALDKRHRLHRFRSRANSLLNGLDDTDIALLQAYAQGVNDGLNNLGAKPFEYYLLRTDARPWKPADTLLVVYAMYLELNDETAERDLRRGMARSVMSQTVFEWLFPEGTEWDAPLMGEARGNTEIPASEEFSLGAAAAGTVDIKWGDRLAPGSNNWAVAGSLTENGAAIVANDMHLGLTTPNIFYRARLRVEGDSPIDLNGVTLPGVPVLVAGSNGRIAWANTNSYGDWTDAVVVIPGDAPGTYLTPEGNESFDLHRETIRVRGAAAEQVEIRETIWGPVIDDAPDPDQVVAVSWVAHHEQAITLGHLDLELAGTVEEALDIANRIGSPSQNFVVGDSAGNIGWTIAGRIPVRGSGNPGLPQDWSQTGGWRGWVAAEDYPRIVNPESARIWTANARVVDGNALAIIGDGGYELGARARQIRDALMDETKFTPQAMLKIQLDDRAIFLNRWRALLLDTLDPAAVAGNPERAEYRELVERWIARAASNSVGYRLVNEFRFEVGRRVLKIVAQPVIEKYGPDVRLPYSNQFEGALWSLVSEKPDWLLSNDYDSWEQLMLQAIDANLERYAENGPDDLANRTWGERNRAAIRHPLSRAVPFLSRWLDMPATPLPGDTNMPRVQYPSFGASERFAVSPGDEANGYLHMPAGQSGHPLSDFYRIGHDDWVQGRPSRFLPGPAVHNLVLKAAD